MKLVIHAGTPKTGTSSLQSYLEKNQRKLRHKGILYPHNHTSLTNPGAHTHQWFEKNLLTTHLDYFLENFLNIMAQVDGNTHTILLSSEGIYNFWWDFPEESKKVLTELSILFDLTLWVWFREPLEFIESYYKQCIRNPALAGNPCYGQDLSFSEMLEIDWFSKHLDYQGFVTQCRSVFGEGSVECFEYNADVVQEIIDRLGLGTAHDNPTARHNDSLGAACINMLRVVNRAQIKPKDKELLMPHLKNINDVLVRYQDDLIVDDDAKKRVLALVNPIVH